MGQGLAVLAVLIGAAVFTVIGVGAYLLALHAATAKAELRRLDGLTRARQADVRTLQRDYEIRSRLPELDRWRTSLALGPAGADQFVGGRHALVATASARERLLRDRDMSAQAVAATRAYTPAARSDLDRLIASIAG
jgi:hypothetical protein